MSAIPKRVAGDDAMQALGLAGDRYATTFYSPKFVVKLGGKELQLHEKGADFLSVTFKDSIKELSSFELSLNNWNDGSEGGKPGFKYSDDDSLVALGQVVDLEMGYNDAPALAKMMTGEITAFDPQFPASGAPTITVRGLDRLHRMRNRPRSESWKGKKDSEIAKKIAEKNGLEAKVDDSKITHAVVPQQNIDDIAFLLERAKRINFEVFVRDRTLHFIKTREGQDPALKLKWGSSLVSFMPSLTLAKQVSKVTVSCWHPSEGRLIKKTAKRGKLSSLGKGKDAGKVLEDALGNDGKEEVITTEQVGSDAEAEALAEAVLARASYAFITGQGQTIGLPALRAGTNIGLSGLGARFDGNYYVTESTHRIDGGGYNTSFNVRKVFVNAGR